MKIHFLAQYPHYAEHSRPIYDALPESYRGVFTDLWYEVPEGATYVVCSGWMDMNEMLTHRPGTKVIFTEHGVGMVHLDNTGRVATPFAGSWERQNVCLFLCPNRFVYDANKRTFPHVPAVITGDPKLDAYSVPEPSSSGLYRARNNPPIVALAFHWDSPNPPGTRTALPHYRPGLHRLRDMNVVLHGHPRADMRNRLLATEFEMPYVPDQDEVLRNADLLVADTSSFIYEFAAMDKPVLLLDCPDYDDLPDVGIRFWQAIPGFRIHEPEDLREGIELALFDPPFAREQRADAIEEVYPHRGVAARHAAHAIIDFVMGDD